MDNLLQDLKYALRSLKNSRGVTALAVLALALGVGANTAVFSLLNTVVLQPLPYKNPQNLVQIWQSFPELGLNRVPVSAPEYIDYQQHSRSFEQIAAYQYQLVNRTAAMQPEQIQGMNVTAGLFPALGASAALGRTFLPEENLAGGARVVMLSHGYWQRRFGSDPQALGASLVLNSETYTVIGIMPPDFRFPVQTARPVELWIPSVFDAEEMSRRNTRNYFIVARLAARVSVEEAQAEGAGSVSAVSTDDAGGTRRRRSACSSAAD